MVLAYLNSAREGERGGGGGIIMTLLGECSVMWQADLAHLVVTTS